MISSLYWIEQNMITSDLSSQHCVCWWNGRRWDRASIDTMLFYKSPHYVIGVHLAICKPAFVRLQINGWEIFWKNSLWYAAITMFSLSASIWIRGRVPAYFGFLLLNSEANLAIISCCLLHLRNILTILMVCLLVNEWLQRWKRWSMYCAYLSS